MKRTDHDLRGVLLSVGEVPLLEAAPVGGEDAQLCWQARELDVFLAELDAGGALPDLIVVPCGDPEALRALRGHHRSCCVPAFAGGASPPGVVGWDGVVTDWTPALEQQVGELLESLEDEPSTAPLDSERRAHGFARFVASRGVVPVQVGSTFGLLAPRTLLQAWSALGWVNLQSDGTVCARPALADVVRAPRLPAPEPVQPTPLEEPAAEAEVPTAEVEAPPVVPVPESQSEVVEPAPAEVESVALEVVESTVRTRRAWLLPTAALFVAMTVFAHAAVDAGLLREGLVARWFLSDAAAGEVDWQAPVGASRLDVPQAHPALVRRLANGDPAFRPAPAPVAVPVETPSTIESAPIVEPAPAVEEPVVVEPAVVEVTTPAPAPATPPREFRLEVQLRHQLTPIPLPTDGRSIGDWRVAVGATVAAGQVLAGLDVTELRAREVELSTLRAGLLARAAAAQQAAVRDRALALEESARGVRHAESVLADAEEIRIERDRIHRRNLGLVEEGVLGYSEIRADWEALLAARTEAAGAARAVEVAQANEQNLEARPAPIAPAVDPVEGLLLARLEENLRTDLAAAVLRAPSAGVLRGPLAPVGTVGELGAAAATIESAHPIEGSAALPMDAANLDWWAMEARLETAPGVWMPVDATAIVRDVEGQLQFRFHWPDAASAGAVLRLVEPVR